MRRIKGSYFVRFRLAGRQFERYAGTHEAQATATKKRVEATLLDIKNGRLKLPEGVDLAQFIVSDGESPAKPKLPDVLTGAGLFTRYEEALPEGALEPNTLVTYRIHRNHLTRILGAKVIAERIGVEEIQAYINARCKEAVQADTIKKEVATFRCIRNWAAVRRLITGVLPTRGLKFLDTDQIAEVLAFVKANARHAFIYPMFAFVALTGCRRSEMIRSRREDVVLNLNKVNIREKKRDRSVEFTYRRVDMHPFLAQVMKDWMAVHPGGQFTFCQQANISLTVKEAWYHFTDTLEDGKWAVLRGYHVFRHSFASNLARAGVDQRVIDDFLGHQTEQMRRRYRHLFPETKRTAIQAAFG